MKCEICGRQYVALGVHIKIKHKVEPSDYREAYGMLRNAPLVDEWLSERLRSVMNSRLTDIDYKKEVTIRCKENSKLSKDTHTTGMSKAGKEKLSKRNTAMNNIYLSKNSPVVAEILRSGGSILDVRKLTGSGPIAAKKMAEIAGINYITKADEFSNAARLARAAKAAKVIREKAMARVEKVMPYFNTSKSAAEMCRHAGISIKTYKNWLKAGLIKRHPNGRGPAA